ncbi:hypothetical protein FBU59_000848, partial [Linderina macrospora]
MTERNLDSRFVSEDSLDEAKKERAEAWRKAYSTDPPPSDPPTAYDPRTLYERLQEQKRKKEEEYADSHRLSKQIRLLDHEETEFLDAIDDQENEKLVAKRRQELLEVAEFQRMVAEKRVNKETPKKELPKKTTVARSLVAKIAVVAKEIPREKAAE